MGRRIGGGKAYLIFFGVFFSLVIVNWAVDSLGDFSLVSSSSNKLAVVDFNFFSGSRVKNYISQGYGFTSFSRYHRYEDGRHNGIDIPAQSGSPILSATEGKILAVGNQDDFCYGRGYGKFLTVQNSGDRRVLLYAHLRDIKVKKGEVVKKGSIIGLVGQTGYATAPHLHFSVFEEKNFAIKEKKGCGPNPDGKDMNPMTYLETLYPKTAEAGQTAKN